MEPTTSHRMDTPHVASNIIRTHDVIGVNVQNTNGDNLGQIEEIILDKLSGNVRYAVLSFGGFMGMGNKLFALPWKALNYDPNEDAFIVSISKEKLQNAPGFDEDHWPNVADPLWGDSINRYYNVM